MRTRSTPVEEVSDSGLPGQFPTKQEPTEATGNRGSRNPRPKGRGGCQGLEKCRENGVQTGEDEVKRSENESVHENHVLSYV